MYLVFFLPINTQFMIFGKLVSTTTYPFPGKHVNHKCWSWRLLRESYQSEVSILSRPQENSNGCILGLIEECSWDCIAPWNRRRMYPGWAPEDEWPNHLFSFPRRCILANKLQQTRKSCGQLSRAMAFLFEGNWIFSKADRKINLLPNVHNVSV